MVSSDTLVAGERLADDYEVLRVLGTGGFANTYLARDLALNREVAIKEYFPREIALREAPTTVRVKGAKFEKSFEWGLERFVQEAKMLAKFRHTNIVRVFRIFDANETAYIVLDYVRGSDLEAWLRQLGRIPSQRELDELVGPLLDALELVHGAGILHRDIKPSNICIREETGDPVLLDFGASKYSLGELTGTTAAIVSRGYSPYEAYASESKSQGAWTDIYGFGATLYRAITQAPPLEATERLLDDSMPRLATLKPDGYRASFLEAIDWALAVQPAKRPQNVSQWRTRLNTGSDVTARGWDSTTILIPGSPGATTAPDTRSKKAPPPIREQQAKPKSESSGRTVLYLVGAAVTLLAVPTGAIMSGWVDAKYLPPALARLAHRPLAEAEPATSATGFETPSTNQATPKPATAADLGADLAEHRKTEPRSEKVAALVGAPPSVLAPVYSNTTLGAAAAPGRLTAAAVSPDGSTVIAGMLDGGIRRWTLNTGGEISVPNPSGATVVAVDFSNGKEEFVVAFSDGSIVSYSSSTGELKPIRGGGISRGFTRALVHSAFADEIIAVTTSAEKSEVLRWKQSSEGAVVTHPIGNHMIRAAAIARRADLVVVVRGDERVRALRPSDGAVLDLTDWIEPAPDWSSALALSSNAQLLARGGNYSSVEILDVDVRRRRHEFNLGDQAVTRWLTFSNDGARLAIAYEVASDGLMTSRLRVVSATSGAEIFDVALPAAVAAWSAFLPESGAKYWLALAVNGNVRICDATVSCDVTK